MRYMFALAISLGLVWGATRFAAAQGAENGWSAAELDAGVAAPTPPALSGDPALPAAPTPAPAVSADSTPEEIADATWWALQAGYIGPAVLFAVFLIGMHLRNRRGWIIKQWPRFDDGRVWAAVSIGTMAVGTLVPLAAMNALTRDALWAALVASVGLYLFPSAKPAQGGAA